MLQMYKVTQWGINTSIEFKNILRKFMILIKKILNFGHPVLFTPAAFTFTPVYMTQSGQSSNSTGGKYFPRIKRHCYIIQRERERERERERNDYN